VGKPYVRQVEVVGLVEQLGTVLLFDDLEDLFKWEGWGTGADYVVEKNTVLAFSGNACLHIKTRATTPAAGDFVAARRFFAISIGKKLSVEFRFYFPNPDLIDRIGIGFGFFDGSYYHRGDVYYCPPEKIWRYMTPDGTLADIPGGSQNLREKAWHRAKLILDFEKDEYVSLQCNDLIVDMKGIKSYTEANPAGSATLIVFYVWTETAAPAECYFDDILCKEE